MTLKVSEASKRLNLQLAEVVLGTYNVADDSKRLTEDPESFEALRGNYPVRRDFPAWTVEIPQGNDELKRSAKLLGFNIVDIN
jgi:erythronate-4-phosphate dehydrogenase